MKLDEINLIELLPEFIRTSDDKTVKGLCAAGNYILNQLYNEIKKLDFFNNLDLLSEIKLDEMAKALNVYWYNDNDSKKQKIEVLKNCEKVFWMLGTVAAVEQVVKDVFGNTSSIEEWFQYDGESKYFKVNISESLSKVNMDRAYELVEKVKNEQSKIDGFNRTNTAHVKNYYASGTVITKMMKVGVRSV